MLRIDGRAMADGSSHASGDLAEWPQRQRQRQETLLWRAPSPQTLGRIKRWHQALKNPILLENQFILGDLEVSVAHRNHQRFHESLITVMPSDVYLGRGKANLQQRERIK